MISGKQFSRRIGSYALAVLAAISASASSVAPLPRTSAYPVKNFRIFDALSFRNKPDSRSLGLSPIRVVERIWPPGAARDEVNLSGIASEVVKLGDYRGLVYIDIENWPVSGVPSDAAFRNIEKLVAVAEAARKSAPACQFGYYGIMPAGAYWDIVSNDPRKLESWHEANLRTEKLAPHVDVVFPSLYTYYDDEDGWQRAARTMLMEARRYGKPVYAFLWPEFHDSNKLLGGTRISVEFWHRQLALCRELADGIVLWGGWRRTGPLRQWAQTDWDETAPWWAETQSFIEANR